MNKKRVISDLKQSVMLACSHDDYEVRYNALQHCMRLVSSIEKQLSDDEENDTPRIGFKVD